MNRKATTDPNHEWHFIQSFHCHLFLVFTYEQNFQFKCVLSFHFRQRANYFPNDTFYLLFYLLNIWHRIEYGQKQQILRKCVQIVCVYRMWKVESAHSLNLEDWTEIRGFSLFNVMVLVLFVIISLFLIFFS